jgi:hypothetical protein
MFGRIEHPDDVIVKVKVRSSCHLCSSVHSIPMSNSSQVSVGVTFMFTVVTKMSRNREPQYNLYTHQYMI